ncbi:hypothetical protein UFOVP1672_51 [uncultured Caudovirales phage]|uniref:Recombination endonuclease VII n=1 Tax=uncultured Caudovirales phage TaxID=2100421 RepID=A0A6J5Q6C2_9CAUD|nr:hypothetical protein UFOVP988_73 [uncultured Caudovirales phage]CAB4211072.1 hypothetical protein UFOVP1425_73 [uncultured Caudovirales phage]CAB4223441.1 hypothetical protein UFOVP1672_51 [uncultured Caudovirales phage]
MGKVCIHCGQPKPISEYYRHPMMSDGHLNGCKECIKARARANRAARLDYYREYDRSRAWEPERVAIRKARMERVKATPALRERDYERAKAWRANNNLKRRAHVLVGNGLRSGLLKRQPCERCGATERIDAHHEDYKFPLAVNWLCEPCHGKRHREINAERRKGKAA